MTDSTRAQTPKRASRSNGVRLRVKILGGDLSADQWRALARSAAEFTPNAPLHLTTRQDVEFHDLAEDRAPAVQQLLLDTCLTAKLSCGNTVRNITVCPCSGVRTGLPDLAPLAWKIRRTLEAIEGDLALPRKFKISLSACAEACGQPWINDLGLVAVRAGDAWAFRAVVAGSLGRRPELGVVFREDVAPEDVVPLAVATLRVFAAHADRGNRYTARLRHVRQRMGDEAFAALLEQAFQQARSERDWPPVSLPIVAAGFDARLALTFADGDVTPPQAEALAVLAERPDVKVRIDNHHRVILAAKELPVLHKALADLPALTEAARSQPAIVACPGRRWCKNGLTDTAAMAETIRAELGDTLSPETIVAISGCPNNCVHGAVAPIGLTGGRADDQDAYTLVCGGGLGKSGQLARPVASRLKPEAVVKKVRESMRSDLSE